MPRTLLLALLMATLGLPSWAQQSDFAQGARVVARPSSQWEDCTVSQVMREARAYGVKCRTGEYIVSHSSIQAPTAEAMALTRPPSAQPGMPQVGESVMASPMGLDNDWRPCVVIRDLTHQNAYEVRCGKSDWTVAVKWVKKASAAGATPGSVSSAPAAPSPAAPPQPVTPSPAPPPQPVTPSHAPPPQPVTSPPAAATTVPAGSNGAIPDGVYVAPVGGSIEAIQIIGGRMAYKPRIFLTQATMTTAHAAMVGSMQVAGNSLTVTWHDGKTRNGQFKMDGTCLVWGYLYCRAKPFARGSRLEGRYIGAATAGGGVVSSTAEITFLADGTYRSSATGAIGAPAGTTGAVASSVADSGRYQLDGWTLRLASASGQTREYLTFPYDIHGPADPIYFDGGFMRKRP